VLIDRLTREEEHANQSCANGPPKFMMHRKGPAAPLAGFFLSTAGDCGRRSYLSRIHANPSRASRDRYKGRVASGSETTDQVVGHSRKWGKRLEILLIGVALGLTIGVASYVVCEAAHPTASCGEVLWAFFLGPP
jgi:hypothetical protein